jgi:hypothetical protein
MDFHSFQALSLFTHYLLRYITNGPQTPPLGNGALARLAPLDFPARIRHGIP